MLFRSSLQSHESTETSTWYEKIVLPHGCCFQWVFFLVMRWKNTLMMDASFRTTSSSHLEINLVGPSQIESSNGSLFRSAHIQSRTSCSFFLKGSESMKFYTPLLVRDEKVDKTPPSSIGVVFSGWKRAQWFSTQNKRLVHCLGWC